MALRTFRLKKILVVDNNALTLLTLWSFLSCLRVGVFLGVQPAIDFPKDKTSKFLVSANKRNIEAIRYIQCWPQPHSVVCHKHFREDVFARQVISLIWCFIGFIRIFIELNLCLNITFFKTNKTIITSRGGEGVDVRTAGGVCYRIIDILEMQMEKKKVKPYVT